MAALVKHPGLRRRFQLYAFGPNPTRGHLSWGFAVRIRLPDADGEGRWRHTSAFVRVPAAQNRIARGVVTLEANSWTTVGKYRDRSTVKAFIRLKVGLGGKRR